MLRAYRAAIERIKADKAFTIKTLSKYMSTQDNVVLDYSYNTGLPLFRPLPYPTLEGIQAALDFLGGQRSQGQTGATERFRRYVVVGRASENADHREAMKFEDGFFNRPKRTRTSVRL